MCLVDDSLNIVMVIVGYTTILPLSISLYSAYCDYKKYGRDAYAFQSQPLRSEERMGLL